MSSSTGTKFIVTTFGESHGLSVGAVVDGCPAGIELTEAMIQADLDRRRPGQSSITTSRSEADIVRIHSGIDNGFTLGTPIMMEVQNTNARPADYSENAGIPRPSHADYTYMKKYGRLAASGGGRASARETVGRVAAGAVAQAFLGTAHKVNIVAWVSSIGKIDAPDMTRNPPDRIAVDKNDVRCPDPAAADKMIAEILKAKESKDSLGGVLTCVCSGVPAGWGEPVFDKMGARLAAAMLSIPAAKGFEIGSGFAGTRMFGSEHNDMFILSDGRLGTATNRSGGIQGGITNGENIVMRVAFKPTATIGMPQNTVDFDGHPVTVQLKGRHDPCVLPRAVPIVEAMAAIVLADMALLAL